MTTGPDTRADPPRTAATVGSELRTMLRTRALDVPLPGSGETAARWVHLAGWGRRDPALARLAEGHADAVAILAEAGRSAAAATLYGVWASRSGRTGARLHGSGTTLRLDGTVRFCSGAHIVDRALVVADLDVSDLGFSDLGGPDDRVLIDVAVAPPGARADPDSWQTAAMAAADTLDVVFDTLPVARDDIVGSAGWYTSRPGFALGGGGVAAVWSGAARGLLERAARLLPADPDAHQLAHLGELHCMLTATAAHVDAVAAAIDRGDGEVARRVGELRGSVERVARDVVERVPRMLGPAPLSRDAALATTLADLALFIRQHHGERDHAAVGRSVLDESATR
ncbi:acyl-CoA dehydrogenase [Pseudonocardia sp. GCM10023141]|uniref:acyl-CoA dehydrogenase n=1 Tax=Pseudonocardia sp. GCM10023141 TaxID=3252653 RepID=UPI0036226679